MKTARHDELPAHGMLPEPALLFAGGKTDTHPLRGLIDNGPYSVDLGLPANVRLAYLAPGSQMNRLESIAAEMQRHAKVRDAPNYYHEYPGFEAVFRVPLIAADDALKFSPADECFRFAQMQDGEGLVQSLVHAIAGSRQSDRRSMSCSSICRLNGRRRFNTMGSIFMTDSRRESHRLAYLFKS